MCWLIIILSVRLSKAQVILDAYGMSTASADLCDSQGIYISKNPASITLEETPRIQVSQITPYSLRLLSSNAISYIQFWRHLKFAIDYAQSGKESFKIHHVSLCSGIKLSKQISFGTKIIYQQQAKLEEKRYSIVSLEVGMCQNLSSKLQYGMHLKYKSKSEFTELYKSSISIGLRYSIDPKLRSFLCMEMDEVGTVIGKIALDYKIQQHMAIRMGWNTSETVISTGILYEFKKYKTEMSASYHPQLGMSYGMGLCYKMGKTNSKG